MDTNQRRFPDQQAPHKNTDHAFVQVGKDGQPVIPNISDGESDARDTARIEKVTRGESQKMDGDNPYQDEDTVNDDEIRKETLEKK